MPYSETQAVALMRGDARLLSEVANHPIVPLADNLVERPWGGSWLCDWKGLPSSSEQAERTFGEAFEIAAFDDDDEAKRHPSRVGLADGSVVTLPALLRAHGEALLGARFVAAFGSSYPLLPKTLDIKELLSVQGHPPGNTEVYVILAADPGANIRLGFRENVDAPALVRRLEAGLAEQRALLGALGDDYDPQALQRVLAPWFAARGRGLEGLVEADLPRAALDAAAGARLASLKDLYWEVLDRMNVVPVEAGQVIYNATPARVLGKAGGPAAAEVHALGNPERREILVLEIRRPGPTFRAWDNVRFPMRAVDVRAAVSALSLERTSLEDFLVEPVSVPDRNGVFVSVDCEFFRLEHLRPGPGRAVAVPADPGHCLHAVEGDVELRADGRALGRLERGRSAIVPIGVGAYEVTAAEAAHVVRVSLPL